MTVKEKISYLKSKIAFETDEFTIESIEEWIEELKDEEWIDGKIPPKEDGSYLCRCKSCLTGNYITDSVEYLFGEWKIGNNWDLIEYRKIPKGSDE